MYIAIVPEGQAVILNEVVPFIVFALGFVLALGGAWVVAGMACGWGHIGSTSVDFWKAQVKIQCK